MAASSPAPTVTATLTPSPAVTATPLPAVELIGPEDGAEFPFRSRDQMTLSWSWSVLQADQRFRVKLWDETRGREVHLTPLVVTQTTSLPLPKLHDGTYRWTVLVEQEDCEAPGGWRKVVEAGQERTFVILQPRPTPMPPSPTPTPVTPTPTPTPTPTETPVPPPPPPPPTPEHS